MIPRRHPNTRWRRAPPGWRVAGTTARPASPRTTAWGNCKTRSHEPLRAGALLTIGARSWVFSGSVNEVHDFARVGPALLTRRIGTQRMVQMGSITPDKIGQPLFTQKMNIAMLTPRRLVVRDSVGQIAPHCGPSDCCFVHKYYFLR